ncbi:hypothetical protein OG216_47985 (plasmid) [Streptomycetaceae bacterium NBC_01309]
MEYTVSDVAKFSIANALNGGKGTMFPTIDDPRLAGRSFGSIAAVPMAHSEARRLQEASLYFATADMTALALAAAVTPPQEPMQKRRLPVPTGFLVFGEPIGGYTLDVTKDYALDGDPIEVTIPIVAVSWSVWTPCDFKVTDENGYSPRVRWAVQLTPGALHELPPDYEGVWLTFYAGPGPEFEGLPPETIVARDNTGRGITARQVVASAAKQPALNWDNESVLGFGAPFEEADPGNTQHWAQVVYTAWQLMSQTGTSQFTEIEEIPRDRSGRKRDAREGITGDGTVRVVNVHARHRPSRTAAAEDAAASTGRDTPSWSCRWPVRPYRRYTCLNTHGHASGDCEHEDRIVPGHIKGPTDKPLRVGETVNLWDHQPE